VQPSWTAPREVLEVEPRRLERGEGGSRVPEHNLARWGELHAAGVALEQRAAGSALGQRDLP
jgi:hypothetical protein